MAPAFTIDHEVDDAIREERKSIDRRDVFSRLEGAYDVEDWGPYATYLKTLSADISTGLVEKIWPTMDGPSYTIAGAVLSAVTGLSEDDENEQRLLNFIMNGHLELREVLSKKKESPSREKFLEWLSERRDAYDAEQEEQRDREWEDEAADKGAE